ncbi:MAG: hypothetical protein ABH879_07990 [archaeon]
MEQENPEEEDVYSDDGREQLLDDDELSAEELAFMVGWEMAG